MEHSPYDSSTHRRSAPPLVLVLTDERDACDEILNGLRSTPSRCHAHCGPALELGRALAPPVRGEFARPALVILDVGWARAAGECVARLRRDDPDRLVPILCLIPGTFASVWTAAVADANAIMDRNGFGGRSGAVAVGVSYWLRHNLVQHADPVAVRKRH